MLSAETWIATSPPSLLSFFSSSSFQNCTYDLKYRGLHQCFGLVALKYFGKCCIGDLAGRALELASVARNSRIPDFSPSWQSDFIQTKRFLCRMISPSIQLLWPGKLVSRRFCNFRICAILYFCISVFVCFTEYCTSCVLRIYPSGRPPIRPCCREVKISNR